MKYDGTAQVWINLFSPAAYTPIIFLVCAVPIFEWQMALRKESLVLKGMCKTSLIINASERRSMYTRLRSLPQSSSSSSRNDVPLLLFRRNIFNINSNPIIRPVWHGRVQFKLILRTHICTYTGGGARLRFERAKHTRAWRYKSAEEWHNKIYKSFVSREGSAARGLLKEYNTYITRLGLLVIKIHIRSVGEWQV